MLAQPFVTGHFFHWKGHTMKTFTLPASDCGCFVGGILDDDTISRFHYDGNGDPPKYGVIIWYKSKDAMKEAMSAVSAAHWPEAS